MFHGFSWYAIGMPCFSSGHPKSVVHVQEPVRTAPSMWTSSRNCARTVPDPVSPDPWGSLGRSGPGLLMEGEKLVQKTICSIWMGVDGGYPFMTGESDYGILW